MLHGFIASSPFLITLGIVLFFRKIGLLKQEYKTAVGAVLFNLSIPALIISLLKDTRLSSSDLAYFAMAVILWIAVASVGFFFVKILHLNKPQAGALMLCFIGLGTGPVVYPLVQLNYSSLAFSKMVLFDIASYIMTITFGYLIAIIYGKIDRIGFKTVAQKIFASPIIISIVIGAVLAYLPFKLPIVNGLISYTASSFGLLSAVLLGLSLTPPKFSDKLALIAPIMKISLGLSLGLLITFIVGFQGEFRSAIVLASGGSIPLITLVFAEKENLDTAFLSKAVTFALLLSLVVLTLLVGIL